VLQAGATNRTVYLPTSGAGGLGTDDPLGAAQPQQWKHVFTGQVYAGGQAHTVAAPFGAFPLFERLPPGAAAPAA